MARLPKDPWRAQRPEQRQPMKKQARFRSAKPTKPTVLRLLVIPPAPPTVASRFPSTMATCASSDRHTPAGVCLSRPTRGHPSVPQSETLAEARRAPLLQTLSQVKTPVGLSPSSPWNPRTLSTRAAPRAGDGGGGVAMCVHALIHVQVCVSVGAAPTGPGGAGGGGSAHLFLG